MELQEHVRTEHIPRKIESALAPLISRYPVLVITGPHQSGKTALVRNHFRDMAYVDLEDPEARAFARGDPRGFFEKVPDGAVIDEIQNVPELLSWIELIVAGRKQNGMFVLTGSNQSEVMKAMPGSLVAQTAMIKLLPLSTEELPQIPSTEELILKSLCPHIYVNTHLEDVRRLIKIHDTAALERFFRLCAGRIGQILNVSSLADDTGISHTTAAEWLAVLEASYIVYRLRPFRTNIGKRLSKTPKLYFYETSLAARLLEIKRPDHLRNHPLRGSLFENLIVSEIIKYYYNRNLPDNLFFYRDHRGNEIDVMLEVGGAPFPVEIKSGHTLNPDFFRAFDYYDTVFSESPHKGRGLLVYGGDRHARRGAVAVANLESLCDELRGLG
ncbi:MAG: ATP-binding protein [Spirochaetales bacterium]|nr:ATP-binding protein [Spirochaetales bacterium]